MLNKNFTNFYVRSYFINILVATSQRRVVVVRFYRLLMTIKQLHNMTKNNYVCFKADTIYRTKYSKKSGIKKYEISDF